jgi:copper chaperone CopZ
MNTTTRTHATSLSTRTQRWALASALIVAGALALAAPAARAQGSGAAGTPATSSATSPAATALKLSVNGMVCAFCAQGIEARLKKMPETADLYINLKQKVVAVEAKPGQTLSVDKIRAEVVEAGYEITQAEPMTQTVAQLREQMRAKR